MKNKQNLTSVFSLFSTGVTIITNGTSKKEYFGCTVNSFTSLSLDPPQFLFCLGNENGNLNIKIDIVEKKSLFKKVKSKLFVFIKILFCVFFSDLKSISDFPFKIIIVSLI